jgi:general stress protein 26
MSIAVPLDELATKLHEFPWGYLVTVRDDGRAQTLAVPTEMLDGALVVQVGRGTAANLAARARVTMVFPGADGHAFSLIVDGDAVVSEDRALISPSWAVLHRPALGD